MAASGVDFVDVTSVAKRLRDLCVDTDTQPHVARSKDCTNGLVGFLANKNISVVALALQAWGFLSSHPQNKELLAGNEALVRKLVTMSQHTDPTVSQLAKDVVVSLKQHLSAATLTAAGVVTPTVTTSFTIKGMNTEAKSELVEKTLLQIKGVVCVSIDIEDGSVEIRSRGINTDVLRRTILSCERISEESNKENDKEGTDENQFVFAPTPKKEKRFSMNIGSPDPNGQGCPDTPLRHSPQYLDSNPIGTTSRFGLVSAGHITLEERLEAHRRRQLKEEHRESRLARIGRALRLI